MARKVYYVVTVHRDRFYKPKLKVIIEARVFSAAAGERLITAKVMKTFHNRVFRGPSPYIPVKDWRVVDANGLKRLQSAAKASVTRRRKRDAHDAFEKTNHERQCLQLAIAMACIPSDYDYSSSLN
jgi:hypothetical protein